MSLGLNWDSVYICLKGSYLDSGDFEEEDDDEVEVD